MPGFEPKLSCTPWPPLQPFLPRPGFAAAGSGVPTARPGGQAGALPCRQHQAAPPRRHRPGEHRGLVFRPLLECWGAGSRSPPNARGGGWSVGRRLFAGNWASPCLLPTLAFGPFWRSAATPVGRICGPQNACLPELHAFFFHTHINAHVLFPSLHSFAEHVGHPGLPVINNQFIKTCIIRIIQQKKLVQTGHLPGGGGCCSQCFEASSHCDNACCPAV